MKAGLSLDEAARSLSITGGMLGKIERATRAPKRDTSEELDHFFRTDGALLRRWHDAVTAATAPDWFREIRRSEERATEIRTWAPLLVPGFLQVADYARAVHVAGSPLDPPEAAEALVADRTERFEYLTRAGGPVLWVVLCESVLRRRMGGMAAMGSQLRRLADVAESRRVRTSVVPADVADSPGIAGPFRIVTVADGTTLVYAEGSGGGSMLDDPSDIARHRAVFEDLRGIAMPPEASLKLIKEVADEFESAVG
jgi:hypothetical protein